MIPLDIRNTDFMLAKPANGSPMEVIRSLETDYGTSWCFEPKWDGVRCQVMVEPGRVRLRGRSGHDITSRYPEVVETLERSYGRCEAMLDGEMLCFDEGGIPQFKLVHKRDAQSKMSTVRRLAETCPATFVVFDVLYEKGMDFRSLPYLQRIEHIQAVAADRGWAGGARVQPTIPSFDGSNLWKMVERHNLEGVMAKQARSPYRPGRTGGAWVKIKARKTVSVFVTGLDPGEGWRAATFGALHMSLWDGNELVPVGKVGSGFSEAELAMVMKHILSGQPLVIEVEFLSVLDGTLRQPVFKGIRQDVEPDACTIDQLEGL